LATKYINVFVSLTVAL